MEPANDELRSVAAEAEQGINKYQAKTGNARGLGGDLGEVSGIDSRATKRFPGSEIRYGDDLNTNTGYDHRIPVEEGGQTDAKGWISTGRQFEGAGGPERTNELNQRSWGGNNDYDVSPKSSLGAVGERATKERYDHEQMNYGRDATEVNAGRRAPGVGRSEFKGTESVPNQYAGQRNIPPESTSGRSAGMQ